MERRRPPLHRQLESRLALVPADTKLLAPLVRCMWAAHPVACMRAADRLEKFAVKRAALLQRFGPELLRLADKRRPPEVRGTWRCCFRVCSSIAGSV